MGPLNAMLNLAAVRLKGYGRQVAMAGAGLAGIGLSIAGPILAQFKGAVEGAAGMDTLATQLGTTAETASRLAYALGTVGISQEELVQFTRHMNNKFAEAASNMGNVRQEFAAFGVNIDELMEKDPAQRIELLSGALKDITRDFDKSNKFAEIFGRRGLELAKLNPGDLAKRMAESDVVGATVTAEQAAQAKEIQRSFAQMGSAIQYAFLEVGRALLPSHETIKEYSATVVNVARGVREWVSENRPLVLGVLAVGAGVTAAGVALVALGVVGASVAGVISGLAAAAGVAGTVLGAVFSPLGLVLGIVAAGLAAAAYASYLLATRTREGRYAVQQYVPALTAVAAEGARAWGVVKESAVAAWGGIASALKRGDLKSAWAIVVAELQVLWAQARASFSALWGRARDEFLDGWDTTVAGLKIIFADLAASVATTFAGLIQRITGPLSALLTRLAGTRAAKLSGQSGDLAELGQSLGAAGAGAGAGAEEERKRRVREAMEELEKSKEDRAAASADERGRHDADVKFARERLQKLLDEERERAGAGRPGAGEGGGAGGLQQAAREVRGTFAGFSGSAAAQQQLAVGSTPVQRQLVDESKRQTAVLEDIRDNTKDMDPRIG
jgi:hypothetical protein